MKAVVATAAVVHREGWGLESGRHWIKALCKVRGGLFDGQAVVVYYTRIWRREVYQMFGVGDLINVELQVDPVGHITKAEVIRKLRKKDG